MGARGELHEEVGEFYLFPGGGIRAGETLRAAVRREALEETGYEVDVHELLWIRDFVAANHPPAYEPVDWHGVELLYRCSLLPGAAARPHEADAYQVGVEWIEASAVTRVQLFPTVLAGPLSAFLTDRTLMRPCYVGDVL